MLQPLEGIYTLEEELEFGHILRKEGMRQCIRDYKMIRSIVIVNSILGICSRIYS
jgi:hypothetical protein